MIQANPAALAFLAARRSRPAKLFTLPVPDRAALGAMLSAALRVPDHGKLEPWRLLVVEQGAMARLADLAEARARELGGDAAVIDQRVDKGRGQFDRGLLAVVVISSPKASDKVPLVEQRASAHALCMNLVTVAEAAGWGGNWLTGWAAHDPVFAARAFGCTGDELVAGVVHIATPPADAPDRPRPDPAMLTEWVAS